jgi:cytochrome c553
MLSMVHGSRGFKVISAYPRAAPPVVCLLASVCLLLVSGSVCSAGDVKAGRAKALMCQACHGLDGLSKVPDAPNIAGQTEPYIVAQLQAYKSGARKNDAMSVVAPSLSDTDVEDLAAYFSAIEINVVKIPGQ